MASTIVQLDLSHHSVTVFPEVPADPRTTMKKLHVRLPALVFSKARASNICGEGPLDTMVIVLR